jgi:hypothetical protein
MSRPNLRHFRGICLDMNPDLRLIPFPIRLMCWQSLNILFRHLHESLTAENKKDRETLGVVQTGLYVPQLNAIRQYLFSASDSYVTKHARTLCPRKSKTQHNVSLPGRNVITDQLFKRSGWKTSVSSPSPKYINFTPHKFFYVIFDCPCMYITTVGIQMWKPVATLFHRQMIFPHCLQSWMPPIPIFTTDLSMTGYSCIYWNSFTYCGVVCTSQTVTNGLHTVLKKGQFPSPSLRHYQLLYYYITRSVPYHAVLTFMNFIHPLSTSDDGKKFGKKKWKWSNEITPSISMSKTKILKSATTR